MNFSERSFSVVLSGEHGRIKPWCVNETSWFPLPKPWQRNNFSVISGPVVGQDPPCLAVRVQKGTGP